ncbi:MAG TPA: XrtA system polysaccharide chain length determinant [Gammaproteobacteria bacterium]|nr:XrtA system polysaccharide chain length determinant [Gammaproteobacteria bacterium]
MDQILRMILDELRGAWRFRWLGMALAWALAIAGTIYVLVLPDLYEARAQVFLDTSDPLRRDPRGGVDTDAQLRIAFVRQNLLSTPNIERVARETDLDLRAATPDAFQKLVVDLQRAITIRSGAEAIRRGAGRFEANLYNITYRDENRRSAERVVQTLLNTFQEQSLEGDLSDDLQALRFLDSQVDTYRTRLEESEAAMADFQRRHGGALPGEGGGFFSRLATLQEELRKVRADLQIAQQRRNTLAAQVRATGNGESGVDNNLAELESQVLQAQRELDQLKLRYTDVHPSVISAEETLAALQARLAARRAELGPLLGTGESGGLVVANVRIALSQAEVEVTELRTRERDLAERIDELQAKLQDAPQLEAEMAGLTRDYQVLRGQYESLLQRREQLNFEIDRKRQGRQMEFRIIEPPLAPDQPVAPERGMLLLMVLAAALGAGAGLTYLMHQLRPVFISGDAVYQDLQIPVLGTVSMAWTTAAQWRRRRAEYAFLATLLVLVGGFGALFFRLPEVTELAQSLLS